MFIDNKYTKIYYSLIKKRQNEVLLKENIYCESHHIIPKSLGGSNDKNNLVNLLPREHFIAHLLLTKMVKDADHIVKMNWALHKMCYSCVDYFDSRSYEWYRQKHSNFLRKNHHSKRIENWNNKMSEVINATWENNEQRRQETSERMKKTWQGKHRESLLKNNRKISKIGAQAAKLVVSKKIEYKGHIYIGWQELLNETGISKFLYKRFYLKGFDPSDRIGKNGPIPKNYVFKPLEKRRISDG
jgi:5-methylcytosine-specific restriction endonuclease McrA